MKRSFVALTLASSCAVGLLSASATTYYVSPDGSGDGLSAATPGAIATIMQKLASNDEVRFAKGDYHLQQGELGVHLLVKAGVENITFLGPTDDPNDAHLIASPTDKFRIFYFFTGGHVIRNLRISGGRTDYQGGGICMDDSFCGRHEQAFSVSNCIVENCTAKYMGAGGRGGVWRDCVIRNNEITNTNPGGIWEGSGGGVFNATLYNCVITNNVSGYCGGGIAGGTKDGSVGGTPCPTRAYDCLIGWNSSANGGGAASSKDLGSREYCQLFNCQVISNEIFPVEVGGCV